MNTLHIALENRQVVTLYAKGTTIIYVFANADLNDAIKMIVFASYFRSGEDQPLPYIFVKDSIYKEFVNKCTRNAAVECHNKYRWEYYKSRATMSIEQAGTTKILGCDSDYEIHRTILSSIPTAI